MIAVIQKSINSKYGIIHYGLTNIPFEGYEVLEIIPTNKTAMPKTFLKEIEEAIEIDLGTSLLELYLYRSPDGQIPPIVQDLIHILNFVGRRAKRQLLQVVRKYKELNHTEHQFKAASTIRELHKEVTDYNEQPDESKRSQLREKIIHTFEKSPRDGGLGITLSNKN